MIRASNVLAPEFARAAWLLRSLPLSPQSS